MLNAFAQTRAWMPVLCVLMYMLGAPRVNAQVATSFEQLRVLVKPGDSIQITDTQGRETKGKLGELTTSFLELRGAKVGLQSQRFSERDVAEIRFTRHDSLRNGTLIGLGVGAVPGILFIAGRSRGSDPIQHADTAAAIILLPAAMGAGVGALIDAVIFEHRTVYRMVGQRSSRLQVSPLLGKSGAGIHMSVRF